MSAYRMAKLEALLARVLERKDAPRVSPIAAAPLALTPVTAAPDASVAPESHAATTPPPPPVAVPAVSVPRQPVLTTVSSVDDDAQESTYVSRASGPALVPSAAESHARITTAARSGEVDVVSPEIEEEPAPVSSERTVDPSLEADPDSAQAPPESTRQLATSPPPQTTPPTHGSTAPASLVPASVAPASAPRSVGGPVITRGSLPPDAHVAVEFSGDVVATKSRLVGDLLDATLLL